MVWSKGDTARGHLLCIFRLYLMVKRKTICGELQCALLCALQCALQRALQWLLQCVLQRFPSPFNGRKEKTIAIVCKCSVAALPKTNTPTATLTALHTATHTATHITTHTATHTATYSATRTATHTSTLLHSMYITWHRVFLLQRAADKTKIFCKK